MDDQLGLSLESAGRVAVGSRAGSLSGVLAAHWEWIVGVLALAVAVVAFWVTLDAHFLAHPGWSAVQRADFILGPIGVGLYWRHRRPGSRLGWMLIALGLCGVVYIGSAINAPLPFSIGVFWEVPIVLLTEATILAFPSGRLDGLAERGILAFAVLALLPGYIAIWLTAPEFAPSFSISGCRGVCPPNGAAIFSPLPWTPQLVDELRAGVVVVALSTAGLLVWRLVSGTPPRRRALMIGAPIALLYLLMQATFQGLQLFTPAEASAGAEPIKGLIDWTFAGARSALWYGFLFALIAAELYAARVLGRLNRDSLGRPTLRELEGMVRGPLGDPGLRLGFWRSETSDWVDADGGVLAPPHPDQRATEIDREGHAVITIIHDAQLSEDPELLQAAGAVALLTLENTELDAAWKEALHELRGSRARITRAGDRERRKLERDLHDGAQQRLLAALLRLSMADELADGSSELHVRLERAGTEVQRAIDELRELAHGIYPTVLASSGLGGAIRSLARRSPGNVTVTALHARKYPAEIETALYYCCLEAVQNATKHAGEGTPITIRLGETRGQLHLEVHDNGPGFDPGAASEGVGLENMRDRVGAVGGHVQITSHPGSGTTVTATTSV